MTSLYGRRAEGRIDSWHLMDIIRGETEVGAGQSGSDVRERLYRMGDALLPDDKVPQGDKGDSREQRAREPDPNDRVTESCAGIQPDDKATCE